VSPLVNSWKNNSADCIKPLAETKTKGIASYFTKIKKDEPKNEVKLEPIKVCFLFTSIILMYFKEEIIDPLEMPELEDYRDQDPDDEEPLKRTVDNSEDQQPQKKKKTV
jgi:hypothetical protein